MLNELDRRIINELQRGFPVSETPYADVAGRLGTTEAALLARLQQMLDDGILTRFGPLYHAEKMGGGLTLAAMAIPAADFESVAESVNGFPEVAHNYARDHRLNMWFVLATESPERIGEVIAEIEQRTGYPVYNMPKQEEFFVGLHFGV
ncbi:Lrp/AsnC family transcriptional regulator [Thiohalomonas denitrificans]|uniref:siroheme decarboxylase n=1 Tax=Thiohalomonas denitrificans TaxID=415747 RepID=A0A1G5Q930_9GAMM|nr:Lrp/AsnC family transcriptional regulator [Thiohalomonas denitrificans]SCZ58187.1 DNA-binding transcriptional regulator, Lrp family [Thiohalomonas denitrificans]